MDVSNRIKTDPLFKDRYTAKMTELENQLKSFAELQKRQAENAKKAAKKQSKKQRTRDVLVTGSTKPTEIKKHITTLNQKISEIANSDDEMRVKQMRMQLLQNKIASMEKILAKQVRKEMELHLGKLRKKKITEKVYLTKDDLTLDGKPDNAVDSVTGAGEPSDFSGAVGFDAVSPAGDVAAADADCAQFAAEA